MLRLNNYNWVWPQKIQLNCGWSLLILWKLGDTLSASIGVWKSIFVLLKLLLIAGVQSTFHR